MARLDPSQVPAPAKYHCGTYARNSSANQESETQNLEVLETTEVVVFYNLGVGPCSFRVGRRETANQSKCENKDLMLLMSTRKDETAVQHYIFNRMCQTPYQDYFCETKQNCKHFYSFSESVHLLAGAVYTLS